MTCSSAAESCGLLVAGCTSRGQNFQICKFLEKERHGQLGSINSRKGVQSRVQIYPSSLKSETNQNFKSTTIRSSKERGFRPTHQRCDRTLGTSSNGRGFLFDFFCGAQEVRRLETDPESETAKRPSSEKELQDGNSSKSYQSSKTQRLVSSFRSERCLFTHTYPVATQEVSQIQDRQSVVPVQSSPFRSYGIPSCLHQSSGTFSSSGETGGDSRISLSGRLADKRQLPDSNHSQDTAADGNTKEGRLHYKFKEVTPRTISGYGVRGGEVYNEKQSGGSTSREIFEPVELPRLIQERIKPPSKGVPEAPRPHGSHDICSSPLSAQNETDPIVLTGQVGPEPKRLGNASPSRGGYSSTSAMVEESSKCFKRGPIRATTSSRDCDHRCVTTVRLGGSPTKHGSTGIMEFGGIQTPHQLTRNGSSGQDSTAFRELAHGQSCVSEMRQRHSGVLYKQRRGDQISQSMHKDMESSPVGPVQTNCSEGRAHPGGPEHKSRCPEQIDGITTRVAPLSSSGTRDILQSGQPCNRPVRNSGEQADSGVLLQIPRRSGIPCGQPVNELGRDIRLRISPNLFSSPGFREGGEIRLFRNSDNTILAQEVLVPQDPRSFDRPANQATEQARLTDTRPRAVTPPLPRQAPTSGMEGERQSLLAEGFSEEVVHTMQNSIRGSSARCYDRMWAIFVRWCSQKDTNPSTAPLNQILAFLQSLVNQGLAYRTIGVYRSAISKFHVLIDGVAVGQHPRVTRFMRGTFLKNPPSRTLLPTWDVNVVLKFLSQSPFEPLQMASIQSITFKTVFLVALASARRCSELQALGRSSPHIQFSSKGVNLRTVLGFLPKTANPQHIGETIFLPYNTKDPELCVVRALKHYVKITNARMLKENVQHNRLFVCYGHRNRSKPVTIRTISGWLVKIIEAAYAASGKSLVTPVKAHSTRAQATSRALFNGASFKDIMQAADWRCQSTFIKHYALDLRNIPGSIGNNVLSC